MGVVVTDATSDPNNPTVKLTDGVNWVTVPANREEIKAAYKELEEKSQKS